MSIVEVVETEVLLYEQPVVEILTEEIQGPPGPPGPAGQGGVTSISVTAAVPISGHRIVTLNTLGKAVYASADALSDTHRVLGMSTHAASAEDVLLVLRTGDMTEPSWNWDVTKPVYLGLNGALVQEVQPGSLFTLVVGFPISPTKLYFAIGTPIVIQQ